MTKKIFAMFLAVLMVVSVLPISAMAAEKTCPGKGKTHKLGYCNATEVGVTAPTCSEEGYTTYKCDDCGTLILTNWVEATGEHKFTVEKEAEPATCEKGGHEAGFKCENCNATTYEIGDPLFKDRECEWGDWNVFVDCTVGGVREHTCKTCGAVEKETVQKGSHSYEAPKLVKPATETENGEATMKCTKCGKVENLTVLFEHDHDLIEVEEVPANCKTGTNAHAAYSYCRICNKKYNTAGNELNAKQFAALETPYTHTWRDGDPTCEDTKAYCTVCAKDIAVSVEHNYEETFTSYGGSGFDRPGCVFGGMYMKQCTVCDKVEGPEYVDALGHLAAEVTVPAACDKYAYTFTYCVRPDCDGLPATHTNYDPQVESLVDVDLDAIEAAANKPAKYYMATTVGGVDMFATGKLVDGKLATSYNVANAAKIFVEIVHPAEDFNDLYRLYTKDGDVKTYIEIVLVDDEPTIALSTNVPATYFEVEGDKLVTKFYNADENKTLRYTCYLASIDEDTALSVITVGYEPNNEDDQPLTLNALVLSKTGEKKASGFKVVAFKAEDTYDLIDGHDMKSTNTYVNGEAPTHDKSGLLIMRCSLCKHEEYVEKAAGHTWTKATGTVTLANSQTAQAVKAPVCEDGWQYYTCTQSGCTEVKKEVLPGYGHKLGELEEVELDHTTVSGYDYRTCEFCGEKFEEGERKLWDGANKIYDTEAAAKEAHGDVNLTWIEGKAKTCTADGYIIADCSVCGRVVKVVIPAAHAAPTGDYAGEPADCTNDGYFYTYECSVCKKLVGEGAKGDYNKIPALGHKWFEKENYEAADCETPDFANVTHECGVCHEPQYDATKKLAEKTIAADGNVCTDATYLVYACPCGEIHVKNFVSGKDHVWEKTTKEPASCSATGKQNYECSKCPATKFDVLPVTAHKNEAGELFYNNCKDSIKDRHCINCCECDDPIDPTHDCTKKQPVTNKPCACVIAKEHNWNIQINASTCNEPAFEHKTCSVCYKVEVTKSPYIFSGHKPAAVDKDDEGEPIYYGGYVYEEFTWTTTVIENGKMIAQPYPDEYKFVEFVPASYNADGYWKGTCQICKEEVTQVLPKYEGAGFSVEVINANGSDEFTLGSLVAVNISMNANNVNVFGFETVVKFDEDVMYFVGSKAGNGPFTAVVGEAESILIDNPNYDPNDQNSPLEIYSHSEINIAGFSTNTSSDNLINAKTEVVTLYFRVVEVEESNVELDTTKSKIYDREAFIDETNENSFVVNGLEFAEIEIRGLMDVNGVDGFTLFDLFTALDLIENGKYDVTVDVDKDGTLTLADVMASYNYYVNQNIDALRDVFFAGMDEDEADMWKVMMGLYNYECSSKTCDYKHVSNDKFCPDCGKAMQPIAQ